MESFFFNRDPWYLVHSSQHRSTQVDTTTLGFTPSRGNFKRLQVKPNRTEGEPSRKIESHYGHHNHKRRLRRTTENKAFRSHPKQPFKKVQNLFIRYRSIRFYTRLKLTLKLNIFAIFVEQISPAFTPSHTIPHIQRRVGKVSEMSRNRNIFIHQKYEFDQMGKLDFLQFHRISRLESI